MAFRVQVCASRPPLIMDDLLRYQEYQKEREDAYEAACLRCGACCGVYENDPCVKLFRESDGRYTCSDYENRYGMQRSIHGNEFKCVSLRRIRFASWAGSWRCGYKRTT